MYILDTDHISLIESASSSKEAQRIRFRLARLNPEERITTIITFEEQMRGWLAVLSKSRSLDQQVEAYQRLKRLLKNYLKIEVLDFDARAAAEFKRLKQSRFRIGTMDLKIAAITLAHDATLLTRNLKDFNRVPDLRVEDRAE